MSPEDAWNPHFDAYDTTLDDFSETEISAEIMERKKSVFISSGILFSNNTVKMLNPRCPFCSSPDTSRNGSY